jgi:hypothetical protein
LQWGTAETKTRTWTEPTADPTLIYDKIRYKTYEEFLASSKFSSSAAHFLLARELQHASTIRKIQLSRSQSQTSYNNRVSIVTIVLLIFFLLSIFLFFILRPSSRLSSRSSS